MALLTPAPAKSPSISAGRITPNHMTRAARSSPITISGARSRGGEAVERFGGELSCVLANILGPRLDQLVEAVAVTGKQGARCLLETGPVAGHDGHEPVRGLLRLADAILAFVRTPGLLHEFAERDRSPAGLGVEPIPVPRQQRNLARDDAQLRTAWSARCVGDRGGLLAVRLSQPQQHLFGGSAEIHLDGLAGGVVEDQHLLAVVDSGLDLQRDLREVAGRDAPRAVECGAMGLKSCMHGEYPCFAAFYIRVKLEVNITRVKSASRSRASEVSSSE